MRTLASRIVHTERAEFVGRRRELLVAETLFAPHAPASVLLVHGPSGIGKSMLLREIARRGADAGWTPFALDPRDLAPDVRDVERPLLLIDDYEATSARGARLRAALLPARAVVVIAGREDPERAWFEGGWETVTLELPLKPLSAQESRRLLERLGLDGDPRTGAIIAWAGGRPLSLRLGATAARTDPEWAPGRESAALCAHLRRIVEAGLDGPHADVYALGCVARVVTHAMLADLLPDVDAPAALRWLAGCGFALHPAVRQRLRAELRAREPQLERELRGRVADFLHARGDLALTVDLADLVEDPTVRSGYSCDGESDYHVSGAGPDDEALAPDEATRAFLRTGHALVARDAAGRPAGYAIAFTSDTDSALARADPRLGRWLADAPANAIVWRDCVDLTRDPRSRVQALLNMATVLGCGVRNPRYAYLPIAGDGGRAFAAAVGARHAPELDSDGIECHIVDFGPAGLLGAQRDLVHRELGRPPAAIDPEAVRAALRHLQHPAALAASPLAAGRGADGVRAMLADAAEHAFGATPDEQLLRSVLIRGYFEVAGSHEAAARELHLSRAAYFRRLRSASERVAAWLTA